MYASKTLRCGLAGAMAGLVNGLFGGGGGMVLIPLLVHWCKLPQQKAFATSVAIILPLCAVSATVYLYQGTVDVATALPYLIGGGLGGVISGRLFQRCNPLWLQRGFALLLLYGGLRALWP